jgi:hypothetical protein
MRWSKTFNIGHYIIQTSGFFVVGKLDYTPRDVEKVRMKYFSENSIKIGRIKAIRRLSPTTDLRMAKIYVELSFKDNGEGGIKC